MNDLKITDVRAVMGDSAFLIDNGETAIMYDSGFGFTAEAVCSKIASELGDRELNYIFLTHSHYDHALGSVLAKKKWPDAKVVAGEYAAKIFSKPSAKDVMRQMEAKARKNYGASGSEDLIDALSVDIAVKDGEKIQVGKEEYEAIHLPGHTRCSFGFYNKNRSLLLGSETLGVYDGEGEVVPAYLIGYRTALNSIEKIKNYKIDNILVPHYGLLSKKETVQYLERSRYCTVEFAQSARAIYEKGGKTEDVIEFFKEKYYNEKIKSTYPPDAMELNTRIMAELIKKEFEI